MDEPSLSKKEFLVTLAVIVVCGALSGAGATLDWGYWTALIWPIGVLGLAYWYRHRRRRAE